MSKKIKDKEGFSKKPKTAENPVAPALPENDFSEEEKGAVADNGGETSEANIQPPPINSGKRRCECCGAALSMYNTDNLCWPCDKTIAEWKNFSTNRSEIERNMSDNCLKYVAERLSGRKRAGNAAGGEISSGSWARASGRKQIKRR